MSELQRQQDERDRWIKSQQEQRDRDEQKRLDEEARAREERERVDKKAFEDKKTDQERGYDESKRFEEKRRSDKRDQGRSVGAEASSADVQPEPKEQADAKTSTADMNQLAGEKTKPEQTAGQQLGWTADQTPFFEPENKPSFAAPKREDPKLEKPTTLAERTAIRNAEKSLENERAGRTRPPAHTVERAEQAEAKLQQAQETNTAKTKKSEQSLSPTMEKTL